MYRLSPCVDLEQFEDGLLFGLGLGGASAAASGRPPSEVRGCRTAVVSETGVSPDLEEGLDSSRAAVSDCPMQRCHAPGSGCVGISARLDEIADDPRLTCRVPTHRSGDPDHSRMKRFGFPAGFWLECQPPR